MRDYDDMIARQIEQAGVRMTSGQHIDTAPHPRHRLLPHKYDEWLGACYGCGHPEEDHEPPDADPWIDRRDHYER